MIIRIKTVVVKRFANLNFLFQIAFIMPLINTKFKTFINDRWNGDLWVKIVGRKAKTIKWFKQKTARQIRKFLKKSD